MARLGSFGVARALILTAGLLGLCACGGGGGGGGGGTGTAVPSPPPPVTPVPVGPSVTSPEYSRNWGVSGIKAEAGWARGASGAGIVVAVIDSGVNPAEPDLAGRVSTASRDINAARNQPSGSDPHGTFVAGVIASNYNNTGTIGVAFNSTILSVRADNAAGTFNSNDVAAAIDYAVASGARVINLSLGTTAGPLGPAFEAAVQRAVNAGAVFAVAAGNDGGDGAEWPGGYSVDTRYGNSILAVGSINQAGGISPFSHRAGVAGGGFVVAPGEDVTSRCDATGCRVGSGTSYAAPHVAGSLALVLEAFPNLSGRQAVDLLTRTARDLGAPGNDSIYGWGAVDLQRAFAPVGALGVPVAEGGVVSASLTPGATMGPAFGDAVLTSGALSTVGWDYYQRPFATDLAAIYGGAQPSILSPHSSLPRRHSEVTFALARGSLNIAAAAVETPMASPADRFGWMPQRDSRDVTVSYRAGGFGLTAWSGEASASPFAYEAPDPYMSLAQADHAARADYQAGRWLLSAEAGGGRDRLSPDLMEREDGARYGRVTGRADIRGVATTITFGQLAEPLGPLGAYLPARSGMALPSSTTYAAVSARWPLANGFELLTEAGFGRTRLSGRFLSLEEAALSSAWKVSLAGDCRVLRLACGSVRLTAAQPLRIEAGRFLARLPVAPTTYFGPAVLTDRRFDADPSGRQVDFTLSTTQRAFWDGVFQLDAVASIDAGHRAASVPAYGLLASWRAGF